MALFTWTEEFSVGVRELDQQHQHLFQMLDEIVIVADRTAKQCSSEQLIYLLEGVINYGLYHMSIEEEYMTEFSCKNPDHFASHDLFRGELKTNMAAVTAALKADAPDARAMVRKFAVHAGDWHVEHISLFDKTYIACFHEHGLE